MLANATRVLRRGVSPAVTAAVVVVVSAVCVLAIWYAVDRPGRARPEPRDLSPGDPARLRAAGPLPAWKLALGGETRNAVFPAPDEILRLATGECPGARQIEVATGLICTTPPCTGRAEFVVRRPGSPLGSVLLRRVLSAERDRGHWTVDRFPAGPGGGGAGQDLEFRVRVEAPGSARTALIPVWGDPLAPNCAGERPNVLVISIDALRADHLGCYGHGREGVSPRIDAFADESVRFREAVSEAPWTTPSHMSLMTSMIPSRHGVNQSFEKILNRSAPGPGGFRRLPDEVVTLAESLRGRGYRTLALTGGATLSGSLGFDQGFDVYREGSAYFKANPRVRAELFDWLSANREGPFFLFFHTFEVHAPYTRMDYVAPLLDEAQRERLDRLFARADSGAFVMRNFVQEVERELKSMGLFRKEITTALYDAGIRRADTVVGEVLDELRALGLYDRTIVVLTSDHGEEFADHDPQRIYDAHCTTLYDELLRVPLLVRVPGRFAAGADVRPQVRLIDVAPTILDLLGVEHPAEMQGRSLAGLMAQEPQADEYAVGECVCEGPEWKSLRGKGFKFVMRCQTEGGERGGIPGPCSDRRLFDLGADPGETRDVLSARPALARDMESLLERRLRASDAARGRSGEAVIGEGVREQMRALGYGD